MQREKNSSFCVTVTRQNNIFFERTDSATKIITLLPFI